jgi:FkbM family methyltransferase
MSIPAPINGTKDFQRRNWFGAKRQVKRLLGFKPWNRPLIALLSGLDRAERFYRIPANLAEVQAEVEGQTFTLLHPMQCCLANELFWGKGQRLKPDDRLALKIFFRLAQTAEVVFDIGANTGLYSLVAARANPELQIHAFEIVPEVMIALQRNFFRNDIHYRSECHFYGIGKEGAVLTMPLGNEGSGLPTTLSSRIRFDSGVRVQTHSLDSLAGWVGDRSRVLLKIDVEGTENEIFASGEKFIQACRPDILCEVLPRESAPDEIQAILQRHSYRIYQIQDHRLEEFPRLIPEAKHLDWLLTRKTQEQLQALALT